MSPRPNVSDERKVQIINAAEDVFTKKGFDEAHNAAADISATARCFWELKRLGIIEV